MTLKITCVHQGYELYGSDRSFIQCVGILRKQVPDASVTVIIPSNGPIVAPLEALGCDVRIERLFVLRKKDIWKNVTLGLPEALRAVYRAGRTIAKSDFVYVNTAVVADYYIAARAYRDRVVGHVREIPVGLTRLLLGNLLRYSGVGLLANSHATAKAFSIAGPRQIAVVYNGTRPPPLRTPTDYGGQRALRLLLLGRLNAWKGQDLLLEALQLLPPHALDKVNVRLVGDAFEGQPFGESLRRTIAQLPSGHQVSMTPFDADPTQHFTWADVVVVPSRAPEPFGRVAIEAFSFCRPVIAAAHGGLAEVVTAGHTGWHFEPNNAHSLASAIMDALLNPALVKQRGLAGQERFMQLFTSEAMEESFWHAIEPKLRKALRS
ncbi:glycosyltransferase [Geminicoccus harenae]|uniref:glycosyltransferase n=1 Tax=Geminicoccus harenae TaxID=2498453 RepID=UPI00168ACD31|nr:glycosyltransferase [Geminicoccus harenae]